MMSTVCWMDSELELRQAAGCGLYAHAMRRLMLTTTLVGLSSIVDNQNICIEKGGI